MIVLQALYLFAPLLVASAVAGVVMRFDLLKPLARPIDGGRSWRGHRVFGDGKTWRGVVVSVATCIASVAVQRYAIGDRAGDVAVVNYDDVNVVLFGGAMGLGAMLGELPNSFVKRRLGIARGKGTKGRLAPVLYVWDQIDLLTTTWPLLLFWVRPSWALVGTSVALVVAVHPAVSLIGYLIGARRTAR